MTGGQRTPAADYVPGHGDLSFSVDHYDLSLDYRVEGNRLTGRATLTCRAVSDLDLVVLDLFGLTVSKVGVDGRAPARFTHRDSRLRIQLAGTVTAGSAFTVVVGYHGLPRPMPGPDGEAGWEELADGVIVAGQPHGAPSWFPCNDRPSDKASYRVTANVATDYHVVGNGALELKRRQASTTTWVYHQAEPMAPYLATLQIGRYAVCPLEASVPMEVALPPGRVDDVATAFGRQPEMLDLFVELFGAYPYGGYRVVVTEDELEIPLEAQGLSIFGSNFLTGDWKAERLVAHELSHQWFGNSLTVSTWADIWLHEGFACYAEWLWSERSGRESADEQARTHWDRLSGEPQDLLLGDPGPEDMFDDRVYKRGALLLHALRLTVGDESFFDLLRAWVSRHAHGNVTTEDFTTLAAELTRHPLESLFDSWLYDVDLPGLPAAPG